MNSFRYRTKTLLGTWRETFDAAVQDSIRAKQAREEEGGPCWHWVIDWMIEEREGVMQNAPRKDHFNYSQQRRRA